MSSMFRRVIRYIECLLTSHVPYVSLWLRWKPGNYVKLRLYKWDFELNDVEVLRAEVKCLNCGKVLDRYPR